jgi:hypothetical protein
MKRINPAIAAVLVVVCSVGCASGPWKGDVKKQLEQHEVFAKPIVWYICLGTQTKEHEATCLSGLDTQARSLGLTQSSTPHVTRMLLGNGSVAWIPTDAVQSTTEKGGKVVVAMIARDGSRGWIPELHVGAAKKVGFRLDGDPNLNSDEPVLDISLTDKGRQVLTDSGSILDATEAGFVVGHRQVVQVTRINRLGPDSVSAEFQWRAVPTEIGKTFKPTFGIAVHTAKALFRPDEQKRWKLMDPHSWESDDPRAKEFDLNEQTLEN